MAGYQYLVFAIFVHLSLSVYIPRPSTSQPHLLETEQRCPFDCSCNFQLSFAICRNGFSLSTLPNKTYMYQLRTLSIKRLEEVLFEVSFSKFTNLENLDLSGNVISEVPEKSFRDNTNLRSLNLNNNYIHSLNQTVFYGLSKLVNLDLSNNNLNSLGDQVFDGLENLESLNLSMNAIVTLPLGAFKHLSKLKLLDLAANDFVQLTWSMLEGLESIQILNISHNNLITISEPVALFSDHLLEFVISKNNFDCSCELVPMIGRIKASPLKYGNPVDLFCNGKYKLLQLENSTMECELPRVYFISNSTSVIAHGSVNLQCQSYGVPTSINYWRTPWGENFSHVHLIHILQSYNITAISSASYIGYSLGRMSNIRVKDDGSLYIDQMRGYFAGDFLCIALNGFGTSNHSVHVGIHDALETTVHMSLFHGAGCMVLFLLIGIVIGSISLCAQKCKCCKCCSCCSCAPKKEDLTEPPEFTFVVEEVEEENKHATLDSCNSNSSYYSQQPPGTPFNSPLGQTPRASPMKCPTPGTQDPSKSPNIKDTLEEVKVRLEKKMEKVRGHYNSIKESGSVYLSTIKGTAATKVASGVEQVKFSVRSIKEFCGTGDMGTQTISALSFQPDVDMATQTDDIKFESTGV